MDSEIINKLKIDRMRFKRNELHTFSCKISMNENAPWCYDVSDCLNVWRPQAAANVTIEMFYLFPLILNESPVTCCHFIKYFTKMKVSVNNS